MSRYDPAAIEPKWQAAWDEAGAFTARRDPARPKYYVLEMFPYPSGRIHMGHVRNYTMGDVVARYKAAQGFRVLHPMGWDAFGMPAENAAMERGGHPKDWTYGNIADMQAQMKPWACRIDWSREFATCDPEYYGQQQAMFIDMLEAGLVYRKAAVVNWDPVDMTVLANEQVIDGKGWRSGAAVERRELTQWFFKISRLFRGVAGGAGRADALARKGAADAGELDRQVARAAVCVSTRWARPTGLTGWRFIPPAPTRCWARLSRRSAPDHPLAKALERHDPKVAAFWPSAARAAPPPRRSRRPRRWAMDTGIRVQHPLDPDWELPVWIANFILMDYGTGAIFGCPAHDQRDFEFATKYGLPINAGVRGRGRGRCAADRGLRADEVGTGALCPRLRRARRCRPATRASPPPSPMPRRTAMARASPSTACATGGCRRQRYWGCPIPVVHCADLRRGAGDEGKPAGRTAL